MAGFRKLAALVLCAGGLLAQQKPVAKPAPKSSAPEAGEAVIASGKFQLLEQGAQLQQKLEEPWRLKKVRGGFLLDEQWVVAAEANASRVPVQVNLSAGYIPTVVTIGDGDAAIRCAIEMSAFSCTRAGQTTKLPMSSRYYFLLPSPWMVSAIARSAPKAPGKVITVQLVRIAGVSQEGPQLESLSGELQYVGEDEVEVQGKRHAASIYELRSKAFPAITIWVDAEMVPVLMQDSGKPEQRIELVEFSRAAR